MFILKNKIFFEDSIFSFNFVVIWRKNKIENFNISENNRITVKAAKVVVVR
jgi:hypothetical protein